MGHRALLMNAILHKKRGCLPKKWRRAPGFRLPNFPIANHTPRIERFSARKTFCARIIRKVTTHANHT